MKRTNGQRMLFVGGVIFTVVGGASLLIQAIQYLPRLSEIVSPAELVQSFIIASILLASGLYMVSKAKPSAKD